MYNRQNKTNSLVEAGLIVSLMIVLIMLNLYFPIFSIFITFLLPIPIAVLYLRQDYKITLWAILVTGVITAMINNPITAVIITISFGTIGFLLGYCIKKTKINFYDYYDISSWLFIIKYYDYINTNFICK